MLPRRAAVLLLLSTSLSPLTALEPQSQWEAFGTEEGLSGSAVTGIAQDEAGFLWFSTQSGLNRWDGYTMRVWQKEPFGRNTLSHNLIQTMIVDKGVLWLGTYGGLDRFDIATETFQSFRHFENVDGTLSHNVVTRVYRDSRGSLWVGTLDGLNRMDEAAGRFRVYSFSEGAVTGLSGKTVRALGEDSLGRLWVGSSGGLDLYDPARDRLIRYSEVFSGKRLPPGAVMGVVTVPGDRALWLGLWGQGLVRVDPATGDSKTFALPDSRVFGLNLGESGELHIGTWGGGLVIFRLQDETAFTFRHDANRVDSLGNDVVYGSFQDRSGLIWVATNGGGVSRYNPRRQQFQFLPTAGRISVLQETSDGSIWAGPYSQGLVRIRPDGTTQTWRADLKNPNALSNDIVNSITEDTQGRLWLGTNYGVSIFENGKFSRLPLVLGTPNALPDDVIDAVTIDRHGDWWFGTYRSGVVRRKNPFSSEGQRVYQADGLAGSLPENLIYFVKEDREGRIWLGTNGGLALYLPDIDRFRVWAYDPRNPDTLPGNTVRGLLEDSRGRFWVATNGGGVSLLDPGSGRVQNIGLAEGLSSLSVYSVLEDSAGLLWIATANGMFSYQPETKALRPYGTADGLDSAEFSSGAVQTRDGRLGFGTLHGVLVMHPGVLKQAEPPPAVALTGLRVLGNPRPVTENLTLGWQENAVTFSFSVLDFRNPSRNQYYYQLVGFDRDWINAQTRHEATYTNLWPGTYHFRFKGGTASDVWTTSSQEVRLIVEASPWASWYAWGAYAAVLLTMIYLYQRARVSRSLAHKVAELEVLRLQLEDANGRLDQLSRLDGLTGVANRRALDRWVEEEWLRALRHQEFMAVLMIDVDDFKRFNDCYGHGAGDACLKAVAATLSRCVLRPSDFCARYGGEEFVIVLSDTDEEGAKIVAYRVLEAVDGLQIVHKETGAGHVTVSVGAAAVLPASEQACALLMQKADQRLYEAKTQGRHCVVAS